MRRRQLPLRGAAAAGLSALVAAVAGIVLVDAGASAWTVLIAVALLGLGGFAAGYLALFQPGRALSDVSDVATRITAGELGHRASVRTAATERLTDTFNLMAARVQELVEGLAAERARLQAVFEASTDALVALSATSTVRYLNPAAARLFEVDRGAAVGRAFIESARDYELDLLARRAIEQPDAAATAVITFGPKRIPLRAVAVPIRDGGDWSVLLILNDLTEVQRIDQVRRDFLSNVSHELRTPLASIRAMVETLEEGGMDDREDAEEFLRRIRQQVDRLTDLVNELLDLSRIESGAIELNPRPIDLAALVAEAVSLMRTRLEAADVRVECPPEPGPTIEGDHTSLLRVVSNLLDNAIKFSPRGGTIHTEVRDEGELVALSVRDEGEGIARADLDRVFERFYKRDHSRAEPGVGLGLAIVKHTVRIHGGAVEALSEPGRGATFVVRLPRTFVGHERGVPRVTSQ